MAWDRTAISLVAHGALLVVRNPADGGAARYTAAALSLALALLVAVLGRMRAIELGDADERRYARVPTLPLLAITVGVVVLGIADLVAILA